MQRHCLSMQRHRKAKIQLEMCLVGNAKGDKKGFYKYKNIKWKAR